ncbi:hypothetical protein JCM10295v2_002270 [Rhodotorula toruloides]
MASYYASIEAQVTRLEQFPAATDRTQLFAGFVHQAIPNAVALGHLPHIVQQRVDDIVGEIANLALEGDPPTNALVTAMSNIYNLVTSSYSQNDQQPLPPSKYSDLMRRMSMVKLHLQRGDHRDHREHSLGSSSTLCRLGYR